MTEINLVEWARQNSIYLTLTDGETFEGKFVGYKLIPSQYDPKKEVVLYTFAYPDGKEIYWKAGSTKAAKFLGSLSPGDSFFMMRHGLEKNTTYEFAKK